MALKSLSALLVAAGLALGLGAPASAQDYPTRPVRVVIAFSPAGAIDILGRLIADKLSQLWGQQVVVENRPGGSGNIGAAAASTAPPDGYTLHFGAQTLAVNVTLSPTTAFDPVTSFEPIMLVSTSQEVFQVSTVTPYKSVQDVIDYSGLEYDGLFLEGTGAMVSRRTAMESSITWTSRGCSTRRTCRWTASPCRKGACWNSPGHWQ